MPSQWIVTIIEYGYYAFLAGSAVFLGALLTGRIKPVRNGRGIRIQWAHLVSSFSEYSISGAQLPQPVGKQPPEIGEPFRNPGVTWAVHPVRTDIGIRTLLFPILRWRVLWERKNYDVLEQLRTEFMRGFGTKIRNTHIFAASSNAAEFLCPLKSELGENGTSILLDDPLETHPPLSSDQRIVLFDVSMNSGITMRAALGRLMEVNLKPDLILLLIFNDLVPPSIRGEPWIEAGAELEFLYTASVLARTWKGYGEVIRQLTAVRDALNGQLDWHDNRATKALNSIGELLGG